MTADAILRKAKSQGLVISNVPQKVRDEFTHFAEEEFADNYASCLKYVWDSFKLWKMYFENMDMKLDNILELLNKKDNVPHNKEEIKLLSGKTIYKTKKEVTP